MVDTPLSNDRPSSRDLTWDRGMNAPDELRRDADSQDAKAMGIFATASVVIGVVAAVARGPDHDALFWTAFGFFVVTACLAFFIIVMRKFKGPDDPRVLREDFWPLDVEEARRYLWEFTESAFSENLRHVKAKGRALTVALPALFVEVVLLLIWLLSTTASAVPPS